MSDETKACPNRDCDHAGDFTEIAWGETGHGLGVWVRCDCGAAGPFTLLCDSFSDVAKAEAEARRLWNALPRPLRWTTEPPSAPGWCWVRNNGSPAEMVHIFNPAEAPGREYAGPVPEPIDTKGGAA